MQIPMSVPAEVIDISVVPTIKKFGYIATLLGSQASAVYRVVSGLTPPSGFSYGRYFESVNPLLQFSLSANSVTDLISQGVIERQDLQTSLTALVSTAKSGDITTDLAPAIYDAFDALMSTCATPTDQMAVAAILSEFEPPSGLLTTDGIGEEIANLASLTAVLVRIAALTNLARASSRYVPSSSTDAINVRNQIAGLMDAEMTRLASWFADTDYATIKSLRTAVVGDLNARANQLAPVITVNLPSALPSLVVAQQLYGDATRESELVGRNNPRNPLAMPITIEALAQ